MLPCSTTMGGDNGMMMAVDKYKRISSDKLLDMANNFSNRNMKDSALMCYSLIYNMRVYKHDTISLKIACDALNKSAIIYFGESDYKTALMLFLRALDLCNEIGYTDYVGRIYNNIGNIHYVFKEYNIAKKYYKLGYSHKGSVNLLSTSLNNLGLISYYEKNLDSALLLFKKAYDVRISVNDSFTNVYLHNIGLVYQQLKRYDTAFTYYRLALNNTRSLQIKEKESKVLSSIGQLHCELNNYDSMNYYLKYSNSIAEAYNLFNIMSENYVCLSDAEKKRGNFERSLYYYDKYSKIKDSLFDVSKYRELNELVFLHDMSKVDKHIRELNMEQEIKEKTISMQRNLQIIMGCVLILVASFLAVLYVKNKNLNAAYLKLVIKNMEIVELSKSTTDDSIQVLNEEVEKYRNSSLSDNSRNQLMADIINIMNDKSIFCDPDFSLNKLAEIVDSNSTYVSQIINDCFKKNFRSYVNEYRIKEAMRILSDKGYHKYSIETISTMVGFKSRSTFNVAFKEITGITPSFYIKSLNVF